MALYVYLLCSLIVPNPCTSWHCHVAILALLGTHWAGTLSSQYPARLLSLSILQAKMNSFS
jgi:hypothetical protein